MADTRSNEITKLLADTKVAVNKATSESALLGLVKTLAPVSNEITVDNKPLLTSMAEVYEAVYEKAPEKSGLKTEAAYCAFRAYNLADKDCTKAHMMLAKACHCRHLNPEINKRLETDLGIILPPTPIQLNHEQRVALSKRASNLLAICESPDETVASNKLYKAAQHALRGLRISPETPGGR